MTGYKYSEELSNNTQINTKGSLGLRFSVLSQIPNFHQFFRMVYYIDYFLYKFILFQCSPHSAPFSNLISSCCYFKLLKFDYEQYYIIGHENILILSTSNFIVALICFFHLIILCAEAWTTLTQVLIDLHYVVYFCNLLIYLQGSYHFSSFVAYVFIYTFASHVT